MTIWTAFWIGLAASALLAYPVFRLLIKMNSRQKVSEFAPETHQAKQGTPTMGGLLFVIPFLLLSPIDHYHADFHYPQVFLLFALIGFIDDFAVPRIWPNKRGLGWKQKLVMQFVAAAAFAVLDTPYVEQQALDVFAILFCANAYNFADGLDGLASSIGLLIIPGLAVLNLATGREEAVLPLLLLAGAMIPFAFLNAPKAKVFMGDVGSLAVGALVGAAFALPIRQPVSERPVDLRSVLDWQFAAGWGVLLVVLILELVPVPLQIFWVKVFKRRLFPFTPIHHAFEKAGWPETRVVWSFALLQLVCTVACITLVASSISSSGPVVHSIR